MYAPKSSSKEFERHPTGWTLLVCSRVIDKGTHFNQEKQKDERKISIAFESQKKMAEGDFAGEPFLLFANFNFSMYQNSMLCGFIEDWMGMKFETQEQADSFDLSTLIGKKAFANVIHSGKFDNLQPIGPVPEGMAAPEITGKTILIDQTKLNPAEVEKLSEKMKEVVMSAKEQTEGNVQTTRQTHETTMSENPGVGLTDADAGFDDSIPF